MGDFLQKITVVIFSIFLAGASPPITGFIGNPSGGAASGVIGTLTRDGTANSSNQLRWCTFTTITAGEINYIHVYIDVDSDKKINAGIFDTSKNKIQDGTGVSGTGSVEILTITLDATVTLVAATEYILALWTTDISYWFAYEDSTGDSYSYADPAIPDIDTMPDPLPSQTGSTSNRLLSLLGDNSAD